MEAALPPAHPLRTLFAGLTEHAFVEQLGIADPPLVDYITDLLARFCTSIKSSACAIPPAGRFPNSR